MNKKTKKILMKNFNNKSKTFRIDSCFIAKIKISSMINKNYKQWVLEKYLLIRLWIKCKKRSLANQKPKRKRSKIKI